MGDSFEIGCPKCGSNQITANKKGYSAGKAVAGVVLTGPIGLLAGFHGRKKVLITCLACGHRFKAGQGKKIPVIAQPQLSSLYGLQNIDVSSAPNELNRVVCSHCNTENFTNWKYCWRCKHELSEADTRKHSDETIELISCHNCKKLTPKAGAACVHCQNLLNKDPSDGIGCFVVIGIILFCTVIFIFIKSC